MSAQAKKTIYASVRTHTQIYPAGYTTDKKCFQLDRVCFDLSYPRAFFVAIKDNFCNFSVSQIYLFCEFPISIQFIEVIQIDLSASSDLLNSKEKSAFSQTDFAKDSSAQFPRPLLCLLKIAPSGVRNPMISKCGETNKSGRSCTKYMAAPTAIPHNPM